MLVYKIPSITKEVNSVITTKASNTKNINMAKPTIRITTKMAITVTVTKAKTLANKKAMH